MLSALNRWFQANVLGIHHRPHCDILVNVGGNTHIKPDNVSNADYAKQRLQSEVLHSRIPVSEKIPQALIDNPVVMPLPVLRSNIRSNRLLSVSQEQKLMAQARRIQRNTAGLPLSKQLSLTIQYSGSSRRFEQSAWTLNDVGKGAVFSHLVSKRKPEQVEFDFANIRVQHEAFCVVYENNPLCRFAQYPLDEEKVQEILNSPTCDLSLPIYADVRGNSLYLDTDTDGFYQSVQHNQAGLVGCVYINKEQAYQYTGSKRLSEKQKQKILDDMREWVLSIPATLRTAP